MKRVKRAFSCFVRVATLTWLVVHFALTVAYVMPVNPIKLKHMYLLNMTIGTYFQQNWSLFAPNPLSNDQALVARCLSAEEGAAAGEGRLPVNGWHDLSTPFWSRFQQNRFSAYDRLVRPQSNAIREYLAGSPDLEDYYKGCQKGYAEACKRVEAGVTSSRKWSGDMLKKIGSSFCLETDPAATHVALGLRETPALPWSRRNSSEPPKTKDYNLGIYTIDHTVATTGLHIGGAK